MSPEKTRPVATPQKKAMVSDGKDVMVVSPAPAPSGSNGQSTPGQTPIKSPALKKTRMQPGDVIPEARSAEVERSGSAQDTALTLSLVMPDDRLPDESPRPTPASTPKMSPGSEVQSKIPTDPMFDELEVLRKQYRIRIASIIDLRDKKLLSMKDKVKISALEAWAEKEAKVAQSSLDEAEAEVRKKYGALDVEDTQIQDSFDCDAFAEMLSEELGAMKIGTPSTSEQQSPPSSEQEAILYPDPINSMNQIYTDWSLFRITIIYEISFRGKPCCDPPSALAQVSMPKTQKESEKGNGIDLSALNRASAKELEAGIGDGVIDKNK